MQINIEVMISNNTQHKSFLWHLDFEPFTWHTFYGEQCPPFVTEENKEAWRRYLTKVIKKHLKAEVMNTSEFREIETMVNYEKLVRIKNDERRQRMMERQRYWAKMERPRINYIPKGLSVDYEEEYSKYLMQEVSFEPRDNDDFTAQLRLLERWHKKSIPQILEKNRPDAAYAIAMTLCKHIPLLINRDDIQELVGEYKDVSANWYSTAIKPWWKLSRYGTMRRNARRYAAISKRQQDNIPIIEA